MTRNTDATCIDSARDRDHGHDADRDAEADAECAGTHDVAYEVDLDTDMDIDRRVAAPPLPIGVIVEVGPYRYFPFVFQYNPRNRFQWMEPDAGEGCIHDQHTKFGGPVRAILRLGEDCFETASGVGVRFCPACVRTLARACIPVSYKPGPEERLSLKNALYTVGAVLNTAWEDGMASVFEYRGPAAPECVTVPWETDETMTPPWNALPAPGEQLAKTPAKDRLTTPLNPNEYKDRRLWLDHAGMTRPGDTILVGLIPNCTEQSQIMWAGKRPVPPEGD